MGRARRISTLLPPLAATLAVGAALLAPMPSPEGNPGLFGLSHLDKFGHFLLFLALGWTWRRSLTRLGRPIAYPAVFCAVVLYGALLELLQGATGLRTAEWADLAADAVGAGLVPLWRWSSVQTGAAIGSAASAPGGGAGGPDAGAVGGADPVDSR